MKPCFALSLILFTIGGSPLRAEEPKVDFVRQIKPILADRCIACHNSESIFGELNLQSREFAMRKRAKGPVIVPGKPAESPLYVVLTLPPEAQKAMPATAHRLPKSDIALVRQWITEGADWPAGKDGLIPNSQQKP
jgi:hypothetical protein